ncbi:MAG: ABC transporter ATP-binding protein [Acidobacteriota bacterium]
MNNATVPFRKRDEADCRQVPVSVSSLRKRFGHNQVLDGVDLEICSGEIVGLIGANGAGKTTFLRILSSITEADSGRIQINGLDLVTKPDRARKQVGFVPDEPALMEHLTPHELLTLAGSFHGINDRELKKAITELLALWDLSRFQHDLIRNLSHGMKQKLWVSLALLPCPSILLLDEPLNGLDIYSCAILKELLRLRSASGTAILISSHVLALLQEICTRVVILANGRLVFNGTVAEALRISGTMEELVLAQASGLPEAKQVAKRLNDAFSVAAGHGVDQ